MDGDSGALLNVRETAKRLGVHENTVRNWVKEGRLSDARLPGSRFHRFRTADVERLAAARGAVTTPLLQTERRFLNPELVSASQLNQWPTNRQRDAQEHFPELVRRLLIETPGVSGLTIRAGDGVALSGWDGLAESAGSAFLPAGHLALEFGVDKNPKGKASDDFVNRVGPTPSEKTFVFVTPRRWPGGTAWAEERRAEGHFADVRVVDGDDLEGWLQAAPTAHHWISEHLGLRPRDAQTLDAWWVGFSGSTETALPIPLFLAGRAPQAGQLTQRLSGPPQLTVIQSEWDHDVLGFIYAALQTQPYGTGPHAAALVIRTAEVWDRVIEQPGQSILIPRFEGASIGTAISRGHHVIAVVDRASVSRRAVDLSLPRLDRVAAAEAFQAVGVPFAKSDRLAALGRRSMPALIRRLSRDPGLRRPAWADEPDASILGPLVICGSWTTSPEDTAVVEQVTGRPWHEVERTVRRVSTSEDPVLRKVGDQWNFASPEEAFLLLRETFTSSALERWAEQISAVLLAPDPMLELGRDERLIAQMRGTKRPHSGALRRGLAQGLALMGAMGTGVLVDGGRSLAEVAARTVERLLGSANQDPSSRTWHQLAEVLPLFAEAAPDEFLAAVEDDLTTASPVLVKLFQEDDDGLIGFGPSSPYPHLLWAIETVCWSPAYLVQGVQALARLAAMDPGGKTANRPSASLASILCGWVRNTSASLELRLQAIDAVQRLSDAVGWRLILNLWPTTHGVGMPPVGPRIRDDWRPTATSIPFPDWVATVNRLVDRAIPLAAGSPERLSQLVENLATVSEDDRARLIAFLESQAAVDLGPEGRLQVWEKLQAETARHERYTSTEWAMPPATVQRLRAVTALFEPEADPQRFSYLFDWHPDLPGVDMEDLARYDAEVKRRQDDALRTILDREDAADQLARLARRVAVPNHLGWGLASHDRIGLSEMIPWLGSSDRSLRDAAANWARKRMLDHGVAWLEATLADERLSGDARTLLIQYVPARGDFWEALRVSPNHNDEAEYWTNGAIDIVEPDDTSVAIQQLIGHARAWSAISVASHGLHRSRQQSSASPSTLEAAQVVHLLDEALRQAPGNGGLSNMTSYYIGQLLDFLTAAPIEERDVARLEYAFFRLLDHTREPIALNRVLATEPEMFVALVCQAYRGKDEPRRDQDEASQNAATQAWWVLRGWKGFPGREEDGRVNRATMERWVKQARLQLSDADRGDIGDEVIGQAMAHSPVGDDGVWPAEPVRDVIDTIGSRDLESGLIIGRQNARGMTSRGAYDGGDQERDLAFQYRAWSAALRAQWPRTARVLKAIADSYDRDARYHDLRAELDADSD